MKTKNLTDLVRFDEEGPRTEVLHEMTHLWSQIVCLRDAQGLGPITDPDADGLVLVLAGEVAAQVGKARARLRQWHSLTVPAGEDLTLRNASPEPAVVLMVTAPPPAQGPVDTT